MKLFLFEKPYLRRYFYSEIIELMKEEGIEIEVFDTIGIPPFTLVHKEYGYKYNVLDFHYKYYFDCLMQFPFDVNLWEYEVTNIDSLNDFLLKLKLADEIVLFYEGRNSVLLMDTVIKSPLLADSLINKRITWAFCNFISDNTSLMREIYLERALNYDLKHTSTDKFNRIDVIFHILFNEMDRTKPYEFTITQAITDKYSNKYDIDLSKILIEDLNPSLLIRDIETALRLIDSYGY